MAPRVIYILKNLKSIKEYLKLCTLKINSISDNLIKTLLGESLIIMTFNNFHIGGYIIDKDQ